jgi:hypothetical protein
LARGDVTRHKWIYHNVTLREAYLYAEELQRRERVNEYHRQKLYEVVNRSLGGDYMADTSLLGGGGPAASGGRLAAWVRLAQTLGAPVPREVLERAAKGE